jgi:hypothetical protein
VARSIPPQAVEVGADHGPLVVVGLAGLEASSWLHLLQDGDPDARLPRRWRRRRRRSSGVSARSVRR